MRRSEGHQQAKAKCPVKAQADHTAAWEIGKGSRESGFQEIGEDGWDTNRISWTQRRPSGDKLQRRHRYNGKATNKSATGCKEAWGLPLMLG